ncbi:hypothetical protein F25303_5395 [Fusarium sp. NRRL 25303]|nr:hypothetical protein F25303_5395 [Fusarium sp. NRRL 25303]
MKKVKISSLQQTPNKTSSSLILTLQTINSIQQHSSLISTMAEDEIDISRFVNESEFLPDDEDNRQTGSSQRNNVKETSTDHDPNVPVEEPVDNTLGTVEEALDTAEKALDDAKKALRAARAMNTARRSQGITDKETWMNSKLNVSIEEPAENQPDFESSQPESSNAQNTGSDPANLHTGDTTEEDLGTETSVDPDPNAHVEEPVENASDPGPSQPEGSNSQNTGSSQRGTKCNSGNCTREVEPRKHSCLPCLESGRSNDR